ncbi:hypothetical protein GIY23_10650 [Allosaccharopolyspora coralli]|uniref:SAM-dependent chlorinase/fluorinase n=1 Tax=Allosaccharopolyspora coralli TaxID=2665642 RepID=A0A5Q3Q5P3_9PSEU|nr:SAM-dependent chlorinase/fluorinase [Allosaccharopolyspora coralli]QGK69918.1 hypothetical protein GIY23_10650 [Allosaccharopolyspora coralli]
MTGPAHEAHGPQLVSFTTDYGLADGFVAACHGVVARLAPRVRVLDVSHEIPPQAVRAGAEVLAQTAPYLPEAVHLVVVDPGVGTRRRGVVVVAGRGFLVGPDNGVLLPAAEALGGVRGAVALTDPTWWLPEVSSTFHGRDVFAPVAAHLAAGVSAERVGEPVEPSGLVRLPEPICEVDDTGLRAEVLTVDRFGSVQLAAHAAQLPWSPGTAVTVHEQPATVATTFADVAVGELAVLVDSAGHVAVAVNQGSAADRLAAGHGSVLDVRVATDRSPPRG